MIPRTCTNLIFALKPRHPGEISDLYNSEEEWNLMFAQKLLIFFCDSPTAFISIVQIFASN